MRVYKVSYDLLQPGQNYEGLYERLRQYNAVRIMLSEWVIRTNTLKAADIRDDLRRYIDTNDRLLVVGLTGEAAWSGLLTTNEHFKNLLAA
jgi:hypothetical protein